MITKYVQSGTALDAESSGTATSRCFTSYDRSAATKLDYAVNRYYNAAQGRFTQVDPIGMSAASLGDPQSLNLYAYCGNDSVNHVDPEGLFFKKLFKWIGKIFKAIAVAVFVAGAILLTAGLGVAAIAGWAASSAFFEAFGALMGWFMMHPTISSIIGIRSAGGFLTPKINGGGVSGLSRYVNDPEEIIDIDEPLLASVTWAPGPWWDKIANWAATDGITGFSNYISGLGDSISSGLTQRYRKSKDYDDVVDKCSGAYKAGVYSALAVGYARLAYAGTLKLLPFIVRGTKNSLGRALAISSLRNSVKKAFRLNPRSKFRIYTKEEILNKYGANPELIINKATQSNTAINTAGGWTFAGAARAAIGLPDCP